MKSIAEIREISHNWEGPRAICICTHTGDGYPSFHADGIVQQGHGPCLAKQCPCIKFTWARWTPDFKAATE